MRSNSTVRLSGTTFHSDSLDPERPGESAGPPPMPEFSLRENFYPLGFPLRVVSNSPSVLAAAHESWGSFQPTFEHPPLELLMGVKDDQDSADVLPPAPAFSLRGELMMNSSDANNFVVANLSTGRAVGWVTGPTAASSSYLRYHFLEAAVFTMIGALRAVAVHAACVLVRNRGVLLCGESGAGKSTLSYAGARAGWTYISDDASYLVLGRDDRLIVGNSHSIRFRPTAAELFPEIDGHPITPRAAGKPSVEIPTSELPQLSTRGAATVNQILFLNRGGSTQELVPLEPSRLQPAMMLPGSGYPMITRKVQEEALTHLLELGGFELRYHDLDWAIDRINRLVEEGR
jgi:hypothetical protein